MDFPWYHPFVNRLEAEQLLTSKPEGSFLVRNSETSPCEVLSIVKDGHAHHYLIRHARDGKVFLGAAADVQHNYFDAVDQLIAYYSVPDRGLQIHLQCPVERESLSESVKKASSDSDLSDEEDNEDSLDWLSQFFLQQLAVLKGLKSDKLICDLLQEYAGKGATHDFQRIQTGSSKPVALQQMLVLAAADLQSALKLYMKRLDVIHDLFDVGSNTTDSLSATIKHRQTLEKETASVTAADLASLLKMMSECKTRVEALERKAMKVFIEYSSQSSFLEKKKSTMEEESYAVIQHGLQQPTKKEPDLQSTKRMFEVTSGQWKNKTYISIDVKSGKLIFLKNTNERFEMQTTYSHDQVVQLVKAKNPKTKLGILFENQAIKNYNFEDFKSRELFCQAVQQMKNILSKDKEISQLSIFIGTWNMGDANPPDDISEWYLCQGKGKTKLQDFIDIPSDIYVIGTQESALNEKDWIGRIKADLKFLFNIDFHMVSCCSLWGMRLLILVKPVFYKLVNSVKQSSVKTGIANTLGNKGAVGISFHVGNTSFCFINCHLTSGNEKVIRRNNNYHSILRGLNLGQGDSQGNIFDLTLSFHHLFWFGDLNYRIDLPIEDIIRYITRGNWQELESKDQLNVHRKNGNAFLGMCEENLLFPPTYRYTRGTHNTYCWTKVKRTGNRTNVPSYCDRVLWKSYPDVPILNTSYGCTSTIYTSDHAPVYATFDVGMLMWTPAIEKSLEPGRDRSKDIKIVFYQFEAQVFTSSTTKFIIEIHSNCLEGALFSRKNAFRDWRKQPDSLLRKKDLILNDPKFYSYPIWFKGDLPEVVPVLPDLGYLEDQHLLIAVKGDDGHESYGECVIGLRRFLDGGLHEVDCKLMHLGTETGIIGAKIKTHTSGPMPLGRLPSSSKYMSLICMDDEDRAPSPTFLAQHPRSPVVKVPSCEDIRFAPKSEGRMRLLPIVQESPLRKCTSLDTADVLPRLTSAHASPHVRCHFNKVCSSEEMKRSLNGTEGTSPTSQEREPTAKLPLKKTTLPDTPSAQKADSQVSSVKASQSPDAKHLLLVRSPASAPGNSSSALPSDDDLDSVFTETVDPLQRIPPKSKAFKPSSPGPRLGSPVQLVLDVAVAKSLVAESPLGFVPESAVAASDSSVRKAIEPRDATTPPLVSIACHDIEPVLPPQPAEATRSSMISVLEWLERIHLSQYHDLLVGNGWDDVDYFYIMTDDDLADIGISNPEHRAKIIKSARLNRKEAKGLVKV